MALKIILNNQRGEGLSGIVRPLGNLHYVLQREQVIPQPIAEVFRFFSDPSNRMTDVVRYALPLVPVGRIAHGLLVEKDLKAIFNFRAHRIAQLLTAGNCGATKHLM